MYVLPLTLFLLVHFFIVYYSRGNCNTGGSKFNAGGKWALGNPPYTKPLQLGIHFQMRL